MPAQIGTIQVKIGQESVPKVQSITYGGRTLKSATDLTISGAQTGDVITYDSANNAFIVSPVSTAGTNVDGGFF